ncbi:MAG TPA: SDR family NAD(P)-dependent oxidoreductase [Intrasporangium sp.]|nr:SDR family NAD(P)-dependent oxidoreductase [Intrasporangium sp.]
MSASRRVQRAALVTGASTGIGRAIALVLAAEGYLVWAIARRAELLNDLAAEARGRVCAWPMDVTAMDLGPLMAAVGTEPTALVALVHCAGQMATAACLRSDDAQLARRLFEVNTLAPYRLTAALLPRMAPGGTVVFLNSTRGLDAGSGVAEYAMSKHALKALADSVRCEANERGVRVSSVYGGRTATPMQQAMYKERGEPYDPAALLQSEDLAQFVASLLNLPPGAEVPDVTVRSASHY